MWPRHSEHCAAAFQRQCQAGDGACLQKELGVLERPLSMTGALASRLHATPAVDVIRLWQIHARGAPLKVRFPSRASWSRADAKLPSRAPAQGHGMAALSCGGRREVQGRGAVDSQGCGSATRAHAEDGREIHGGADHVLGAESQGCHAHRSSAVDIASAPRKRSDTPQELKREPTKTSEPRSAARA